ncbi:hypothetical protein GPJ59_34850 [Streptomyces bambusae]|uniref:Lipoprotein n=2 Tax=Streptomyces bambusae TaxID=1550616 RepID=A0ABS6ZGJ5_9ACTN|nr:hypothetical protein [Streptomyces bambusae]
MFTAAAAAVLLLTTGCMGGEESRTSPAGNSVKPAGGADSGKGYGSGYGSGYGEAGGSGSGDAPAGGAARTGPAGRLTARDVPDLGPVVTDAAGLTLYRFDKDTDRPPAPTCAGDCAKAWPPVPAGDASATGAVDGGLLGEVVRSDGTRQLTLSGWPVYRYAKDTKPGEAKGEGVGGTWHAFAPDGRKAVDKKGGTEAGGGSGTDPGKAGTESGSGETGGAGTGGNQGGGGEKASPGLSVVRNPRLGGILTDAAGMTLYRFDKDSAWPMRIGCVGACLDTWKPAEPVDKANVSGVSPGLVGTVKRPDGSLQLTIDCWPVYRFTGDKKPGDTTGHGKQGLWWAVTDTGKKASAA